MNGFWLGSFSSITLVADTAGSATPTDTPSAVEAAQKHPINAEADVMVTA